MSEQKTFPFLTALYALLPIVFLLVIDITAMFEGHSFFRAISHFSLAIFTAQFLCQMVFLRGEICPGQRGRLVQLNFVFALFWGIWFCLSLFSNYHYILMDIMAICGIIACITVWGQPPQEKVRHSLLLMGMLALCLGVGIYFWLLTYLPPITWLQFSPFSQLVIGVILAYLLLILSKNRLQNFIALLPLIAIFALIANAIAGLIMLLNYQQQLTDVMFYYSLYFGLHLLLLLFWAYPIWYSKKLNYIALLFMLEMGFCLPILMML
ncbi:hypothetical protein [Volucribacter amazonae]|uniref:Uncharacterized protein n=1 Tax=Volucribacter amazonae TaxID=256731 RepID=A0A9X4PD95_9PAST|nr:hypothetical protein [Volucribacter amazonae]MDG6896042.1 hypothetical protein [Volucribacter amazonae]